MGCLRLHSEFLRYKPTVHVGEKMLLCKKGAKAQLKNLEKVRELSNHLGNVLVTVSDRKTPVYTTAAPIRFSYFKASILSATDYYPFGMAMPGRQVSADKYRYGFNGKEKDKNINSLTAYDYGFRIYNPAIGKFLSVDPLATKYPFYTPYQFASNSPIRFIDLDGAEADEPAPFRVTRELMERLVTVVKEWRDYTQTLKDMNTERALDILRGVADEASSALSLGWTDYNKPSIKTWYGIPYISTVELVTNVWDQQLSNTPLQQQDYAAGRVVTAAAATIAAIYEGVTGSVTSISGVLAAPETAGLSLAISAEGLLMVGHAAAVAAVTLDDLGKAQQLFAKAANQQQPSNGQPGQSNPGTGSGKGKNNLKPDENATAPDGTPQPHSTFKRDENTDIYKYEEWQPNPKNPNKWDSEQRFDGGKPDGSPGAPHNGVPTPQMQRSKKNGGTTPAQPNEIPKNKRFGTN
jgi:RHS repeat-associated protein